MLEDQNQLRLCPNFRQTKKSFLFQKQRANKYFTQKQFCVESYKRSSVLILLLLLFVCVCVCVCVCMCFCFRFCFLNELPVNFTVDFVITLSGTYANNDRYINIVSFERPFLICEWYMMQIYIYRYHTERERHTDKDRERERELLLVLGSTCPFDYLLLDLFQSGVVSGEVPEWGRNLQVGAIRREGGGGVVVHCEIWVLGYIQRCTVSTGRFLRFCITARAAV